MALHCIEIKNVYEFFRISKLNQNGVLNKIISKWKKSPNVDCFNPDSSETKRIDFKIVGTAFLMLGGFFIIACVIAMFENMRKSHDS